MISIKNFLILLITILYILVPSISGSEESESSKDDIHASSRASEIFHHILEGSYDAKVRPNGINGSGPVEVSVHLFLLSIENIDDIKMEYTIQLIYYQQWTDPRLNYSHIENDIKYLTLTKPEKIWVPDVFFSNEKQSSLHDLILPNVFTRIYPEGRVLQVIRITLLLSCPMNLKYYPLDKQSCPLRMESFGWATQDMILQWRSDSLVPSSRDEQHDIEFARDFILPRFEVNSFNAVNCTSIFTKTGHYSCIELHLEFGRQFGYYLIQIYIPCVMLVMVSWVAFFLEPTAAEARVSLGVTTILTIVTQTYGINQSVPPASYVKAIDVWTAVCQAMVFSVILQFSYVNYIARFEWRQELKKMDTEDRNLRHLKEEFLRETGENKAKKVDRISKVLFPMVFFIFNIAYWTMYTNSPILNKT